MPVPNGDENVSSDPAAAAEPIPRVPIWLLKETQPNLRTFRDGNSQVTKFFERGTDEKAVIYEHRAAATKDQQFANLGFATLC